MPNVRMPDGVVVAFPDTMPPDQIKAMIASKFPNVAKPSDPNAALQAGRGQRVSSNIERPGQSALPGPLGQLQNTLNAAQSGAMQGMTFGFGDEINAGLETPLRMVGDVFQGHAVDPGKNFNEALAKYRGMDKNMQALNPAAATTGEIVGGVAGLGKGAVTLPKSIAAGAAYGFGSSDGDLKDRAIGALGGGVAGGVMGATVPAIAKMGGKVLENAAQNRAVKAAIKNAPDAADLKSAASQMFQSVDKSGVTVDTPAFSRFVKSTVSGAKGMGINPTIDPKATAAYRELINALGDVQSTGRPLTISNLHTLRQIAQGAARSADGRDAMFANRIVDGLDNFITSSGALKPPVGATGAAASKAGNDLLNAIGTWSKARKVGLIEEAMSKAQNYSSGLESGLRNQFRALLNNKKTARLWTAQERKALQQVVNGTLSVRALQTLGIFRGMGGAALGSMVGGHIGAGLGAMAGMGGRKATEAATEAAANRAAGIVAMPPIPRVRINNPLAQLPGAALSYPVIDRTNPGLLALLTGAGIQQPTPQTSAR